MAARLFPINVPLTIVWQFTKPDNTNFDITGYSPRLYYRSGNRETEVPSTMISKTGNTLSFTFPTTWPRFEGEYHLKLLLFQNNALWETFHYRQAWSFVRTAIPGSQEATQQNAGETVHLYTCAEYYLFQPIIPTVDSDGYWVVNGTRVADGSGNPVPSSHTVTYDAETNQIIIDQGRVDKNGNSIAQTITALDDALDNQQELYEAAEGTQSGSVSGDGSRWGSYKAAEAARNAARTTAEGTKNGSAAGDGSMWGEYKAAEAARNTARAAAEGTKTGSVAGDGSMWGAFKEGEAARNEASENQEGTKAFSTESDGTRWGEYKNAERERDEARLAAEGSKQRSNAGDGTRWGDYKTAEGERDLQYAKEEGTAASEAHDGTRWGEYKAAEEERDASESRRDSTFNELESDMRSATSAANTAAGAANTAAAGANTAAGKANAAAGRAPYIGENGHWYAWDIESGQYADTGVAALSNSRYEVVSELPDEGDGNVLYLVGPNQQGAYDEYVYTKDGEFVQVGSTYVDLEEKVSSDDIDNIIELTQEEFDALQSKDPRAMYIVTNAVPDSDHVGIASLVQTTVATADEGVNVWTCTLTNGQTFTLNVKNGSRGNSGYTGAAGELEVVNALNSDDATAALSAYQGKVLDGKIDQLGQEVDGLQEKSGKVVVVNVPTTAGAGISNNVIYPIYIKTGTATITLDSGASAIIGSTALSFYKVVNGVKSYWDAIKAGTTKTLTVAQDIEGIAFYMGGSSVLASGTLSLEVRQYGELDNNIEEVKTIAKRKVEKLAWIGASSEGHTWAAGDKIFNTTRKKLAICEAISPSLSFGPDYDPSTESVYIYEGNIYLWNGTDMVRASSREIEMLRLVMEEEYTFDASLFQKGKLYLGNVVADDYSIATTDKQTANKTMLIYAQSGYRFAVHYFDANGDYKNNSGWVTSQRIVEGEMFRICISTSSGTVLANIPDFILGAYFLAESINHLDLQVDGSLGKVLQGVANTQKTVISLHNVDVIPVRIKSGMAFNITKTGVLTGVSYYAIKEDDTLQSLSMMTGEQYYVAPFDIVAIGHYYSAAQIPSSGEYSITIETVGVDQIRKSAIGIGGMDYYGVKIQPIDMFATKRLCQQEVLLSENMVEGGLQEAWGAGMVVSNGKIFSFNDGATCSIFDLATMSLIEHASLPWSAHNNNAQPTPYYYDSEDEYPMFLVSLGNYPENPQKFIFVRVVEEGGSFTFSIVKEVSYDFPGAQYNASWFTNYEKGELYCYTYPNGIWSVKENNPITFYKFNFPSLDNYDAVSLSEQDIVGKIQLRDHWITQSGLFLDGKIFIQVQADNSWSDMTINGVPYDLSKGRNFIFVIDESGYIETMIPLRAYMEPEGLCVYNGALYSSAKYSTAPVGQLCFLITKYTF